MSLSENTRASTVNNGADNILVVDDRRDIIHVIELALEEQPVNFYSASNGQEALRELESRPFDLLLLDAKMPDLSGFEICRIVKNHEHWRKTKIIMISASNISDDKMRAFEAGADDYVTKPFRVQELKARVQVMLNLRQAERELTHRNDQLLELIRVSERLNSRLNLDEAAQEIVKSAGRLTKAHQVYLLLWEAEGKYHYFVAAENSSRPLELLKKDRLPEGVGISSLVKESGRLEIIPNYLEFDRKILTSQLNFFETAGVPLKSQGRHIGVLVVAMKDAESHFIPANLDILTTLANQAAIAIENARLYTELGRENEKYRLIADKASDLIISLDPNGVLTYVNERVLPILGYTSDKMIGKPLKLFLANEGQIALNSILQDLRRPHPESTAGSYYSQPQELLAISKEGATVDLEFNFGLLYKPGSYDNIVSIQAIGRDVTARKRSEENERMRMVGQIASGVAHDLNNVLANVMGHAQLLKTETDDPNVLDTIEIIEQSARDGAETVRRIQEFTVQRMAQDLDVIDLNDVIRSTIDLSRPRWRDDAQQKGMRVEVERNFEQIPPVRGKAAELREVLLNLVNNAIDAMPQEGGKIGFRTYLEPSREMVCLVVWDSGRGMSAEVRRHIFEPFYTTKGVRGTGLGLSVAYGIISRFGGGISVDSTPGEGTTFHIRLPVASPDAVEANRIRQKQSINPASPKFQGRILAIDDEANLRNVLRRALMIAGFEVDVAASGLEALDLLVQASTAPERSDKPYDLIFSDLGMPEMSGWELSQEVNRRWPDIPVVLVTGWGEQLDPQKLAQYNITRTIAKPFNIQDLMVLAGKLIDQNRPLP